MLDLPVAEKPDSQDICFVPSGNYAKVVGRLRPESLEPGEIVHADGRVLGRHEGIAHFTIGQRKGLGIATGEPLFVIGLDAASRRVEVGPRELLLIKRLWLRDVNWLGDGSFAKACEAGLELHVKVRSTQAPQPARLLRCGESAGVELRDGDHGISPGQACVFYAHGAGEARVLGGGFIARAERMERP
jgi:tRNA-specific 2-thiouridylase